MICPEALVITNTSLLPAGTWDFHVSRQLPCDTESFCVTPWPGQVEDQNCGAHSPSPQHQHSQGSFPNLLMTVLNDAQSFLDRGSFVGTSVIVGKTQKGEWLLGRECLAGPPATFLDFVFTSCLKTEGKPTVWTLQKTLLTGSVLVKTTSGQDKALATARTTNKE